MENNQFNDPMELILAGTNDEIFRNTAINCQHVYGYSYSEDQNYGHKRQMEDKHFICENITADIEGKNQFEYSVFSVLDGHGGKDVVIQVNNELPLRIKKYLNQLSEIPSPQKLEEDFAKIFDEQDKSLNQKLKEIAQSQGTCICILIVMIDTSSQDKPRHCFVVNIGDTRGVLVQEKQGQRKSYDHKASDLTEQERVKNDGGQIMLNRVGGNLAVSRAVGDLLFKLGGEKGVSVVPSSEYFIVPQNQDETYFVMASDGLWDVIEDQQLADFMQDTEKNRTLFEANANLLSRALENSKDNISILIVKF